MEELTKEERIKSDKKAIFGMFTFSAGFIVIVLSFSLFTANHATALDCSDHATNGYTTRLGGDYLYPVCYIKLTDTDKFVPLDKLYQIDNYAKLA